MIEVLILSIIQGITEFLPISSSSHLILASNYFNFNNQNLSIDISLHIGSFAAVIFYFKKDIFNFLKNKKLFLKIFISSIPIMIIGFIITKLNLIESLRNIKVIGWTTLIFGCLLFYSDRLKDNKNIKKHLNYKSAIIIGLFQTLSLIPGVSRSGITITAARFLNFSRYESAKVSFLLSIPTLAAISLFGIKNLINNNNFEITSINLFSIFFSFIISFVTIKYFLKFIKKFKLTIFVVYRIILGTIILFLIY